MNKNFLRIFSLLFYFFIFLILLKGSFSYYDTDLGWHLRVGEQIITERSVPHAEIYNYPLEGKNWVDHEWLANAASFWIFDNFGYIALNVFFALLMILMLFAQKKWLEKKYKSGTFIIVLFLLQILEVRAMAPHLGVRMQEITILNLLLLLIILYKFNREKNTRALWWLLPLFLFWANAHAGFLIGFFVLGFLFMVKIFEFFWNKKWKNKIFKFTSVWNIEDLKKFFYFCVLAFFITLINPYGLELYGFLSGYADDFYMSYIQEWLPIYSFKIHWTQLIYLGIVAAFFLLYLIDLIKKIKLRKIIKIDPWNLLLMCVFFYLAVKSKRHFPLFFVVSLPVLLDFLKNFISGSLKLPNWIKESHLIKIYLIIPLILLSVWTIIKIEFSNKPFWGEEVCREKPCGAVKFMKERPDLLEKKIFNYYSWGGYMVYVWPEKKLFIDGRLPQYEFKEHSFLEEYIEFFKEDKVGEKLKEYEIELILLPTELPIKLNWFEEWFYGIKSGEISNVKNYLKEYIKNSSEWRIEYEDRLSEVYILQKD